ASQKSDYEIALGKISFAPGETAKTVRILLVNDLFVEGNETVNLALSNPTGVGVGLGTPNQAQLTIIDNDSVAPTTNPIDDSTFFVRQHYLDFLNREPDAGGLAFWVNQIESCGADSACREIRRINVSAAFFLSIESQKTGVEAYMTHRAAFGNLPPTLGAAVPVFYGTFERDTQALGKDYIVGSPGADAQIEANTVAYFNDFVTRPEFVTKYPATLTNAQYVDNLLVTAGLSPTNFIVNLTNSQENPPTFPTTTGGARRPASFGTATFNMNTAQTQMTFTATISNIDFNGSQTVDTNDNMTAAHIHAGASVTPATNGGVVFGFFGAPLNDNAPNDVVKMDGPGVGGTISGKWDPAEGNSTTFAAQLNNLKTGHAYINFHTTQFGGGEIRGQFPEMQAFRDSLETGLNNTTETRATVLRKVAEYAFLKDREFNSAFVFMEYAGYLRRDADVSGFNFWLRKLNEFNGNFVNAEMVKAFITSGEYRQRFGP
ncbi:MAG: CHRD domain-containing protein, partial [bacterium]